MVKTIEIYGAVLKVILEPTEKFPEGYFYTDNNPVARDLIEKYTWFLAKQGKNIYVVATIGTRNTGRKTLKFHQEYAYRILGYYPDYIDHINGVELDNRDENLNVVSNQYNSRNKPSIGYTFDARCNNFQPNCALDGKFHLRGSYHSESEALLVTYNLKATYYKDYDYDFLKDRRDFEYLLSQELEGVITNEEATYQRVKILVENNPWYAYRYNLFDYCNQNNIRIPDFGLDNQGFMINLVTKQRLCPY